MPINYMIQKDKYSCGIIAVINAIKWASNEKFNELDLWKELKFMTGCKEPSNRKAPGGKNKGGTPHHMLDKAIENSPELTITNRIMDPSIKDIKNHLDAGGSIILTCKTFRKKKVGHAMFIPSRSGYDYTIVNWKSGIRYNSVSSLELGKLLRAGKKSQWIGHAWFLHKKRKELAA